MFEPEFIDEERIPLLDDTKTTTRASMKIHKQRRLFFQEDEQQQQELDVEINALERGFNVKIPPEERVDLDVPAVISR